MYFADWHAAKWVKSQVNNNHHTEYVLSLSVIFGHKYGLASYVCILFTYQESTTVDK